MIIPEDLTKSIRIDQLSADVKPYIAAFIDLMGYRKRNECAQHIPNTENTTEVEAYKSCIINMVDDIDLFRRSFWQHIQHIFTPTLDPSTLPIEWQEPFIRLHQPQIKITYASDGLLLYTPVYEDGVSIPIHEVFGIISGIASIIINWLAIQRPLRGGIDIGFAVENSSDELFGPALWNAYSLESKVADFPRTVIGNSLVEYINHKASLPIMELSQDDIEFNFEVFRSKMINSAGNNCTKLIKRDSEGTYFIDYLGQGFFDLVGESTHPFTIANGERFIRQSRDSFSTFGDIKLRDRYQKLLAYHQQEQDKWLNR